MTTPAAPASAAESLAGRALARGITATWWYTISGILFIELVMVLLWTGTVAATGAGTLALATVGVGGVLWCAATVPLLALYRHRDASAGPLAAWRGALVPVFLAVGYGILAGMFSGLWVMGVVPIVQAVMLLNWPRGIRIRVLLAVTAVIAAVWIIDIRTTLIPDQTSDAASAWWMLGFFSILLPAMTVVSLWWWDVLMALDQARAAEARLAATQERLRVATDVHDLQGHHLQVIALQLELAERLMAKDADAALEQIRLARSSVDEARQGTRDLALRFRSVPLPDEVANAVDLLRAAGIAAESTVDAGSAGAPTEILGPVIRETTTNVLRHGGGAWARLRLEQVGDAWRYEITNDTTGAAPSEDGSGIDGIVRRAADAGGRADVERSDERFTVVVTVPAVRG